MSRIVWLASYPKSGNTWVRALLTNYRTGGARAADINALEGGSHGRARATIDACLGIESSMLSADQLLRYRPLVYEWLASRSKIDPLLIKVHDTYRAGATAPSPFDAPSAAGAIYIVRHPGDIAVSYAHHRSRSIDDTIDVMADNDAFMDGTAAPGAIIPEHVSSWSHHVCSWLDQTDTPVELVTYEALLCDTAATLGRLIRFLHWPEDPDRIARAVAHASFDVLQGQESRTGFREKPPTSAPFFRHGQAGCWTSTLSTSQVARLMDGQRPGLSRLSGHL